MCVVPSLLLLILGAGYLYLCQFRFTVLHTNFMFLCCCTYIDQPRLVVARSTDKYMAYTVLAVLVTVLRFFGGSGLEDHCTFSLFLTLYTIQGSTLALGCVA